MYQIIRYSFYKHGGLARRKVMHRGLTLEQAQAHCSHPNTLCPGVWFEGYERVHEQPLYCNTSRRTVME